MLILELGHCGLIICIRLILIFLFQNSLSTFSMEDLPEPLLAEIIKRVTRTTDLNSLSLVSKCLYAVDAEERGTIRVGCGLHPATESFSSLAPKKVYSGGVWNGSINFAPQTSPWSSSTKNWSLWSTSLGALTTPPFFLEQSA